MLLNAKVNTTRMIFFNLPSGRIVFLPASISSVDASGDSGSDIVRIEPGLRKILGKKAIICGNLIDI